ncbi:hypothetical protein A2U01_0061039, partial [Trifolium medium]|nr:hypothetical protein [Trifolium medium]
MSTSSAASAQVLSGDIMDSVFSDAVFTKPDGSAFRESFKDSKLEKLDTSTLGKFRRAQAPYIARAASSYARAAPTAFGN